MPVRHSGKTIANHLTLLKTMLNVATTFKTPWLLKVPKFNKPKVTLFSRATFVTSGPKTKFAGF